MSGLLTGRRAQPHTPWAPGCQHDTPGTSNNAHIIIHILSRSVGAINRHPTVPCARSGQCRCAVACRRHNVHYLCGACCPCSAVCLVNNSHAWPGSVELTATATVQHKKHSVHNGIFAAYKERICERGGGDQLRV